MTAAVEEGTLPAPQWCEESAEFSTTEYSVEEQINFNSEAPGTQPPGLCKRRGMRAPVLAVGDGALGFWKALREVFPDTRAQRCWFHKIGNVLVALPKSAYPGAKKALAEINNAEDKGHARAAAQACQRDYGAKWPKTVAKVSDDLGVLLAGGSAGIQLCPLDAAVITDYLGGFLTSRG